MTRILCLIFRHRYSHVWGRVWQCERCHKCMQARDLEMP